MHSRFDSARKSFARESRSPFRALTLIPTQTRPHSPRNFFRMLIDGYPSLVIPLCFPSLNFSPSAPFFLELKPISPLSPSSLRFIRFKVVVVSVQKKREANRDLGDRKSVV